jgi:alkyl hydroperoxide reductase subunit AhpC
VSGNDEAVLFSHPKDFTPVCSTELGYMARIKHEFDRRNTKVIGISVDASQDHGRWASDIAKSQGIGLQRANGWPTFISIQNL